MVRNRIPKNPIKDLYKKKTQLGLPPKIVLILNHNQINLHHSYDSLLPFNKDLPISLKYDTKDLLEFYLFNGEISEEALIDFIRQYKVTKIADI